MVYVLHEYWHCMKRVQTRRFFRSVFSRIRTKYGKVQNRKNFIFGHFSRSMTSRNFLCTLFFTTDCFYVLCLLYIILSRLKFLSDYIPLKYLKPFEGVWIMCLLIASSTSNLAVSHTFTLFHVNTCLFLLLLI